ncbi:hypothetical protein ABZ527_34840 [Streptomyces griseofuscus]|uniref:hypothetical protein n=1 Tax=Streptomyces griseofuscus TaxID=146922 RepID=UPI0033DD735F
MTSPHPRTAVVALLAATTLGALTPTAAHAASAPAGFPAPFTASATAQAREAASSPATLHTLSRFFARAGALKADAARPHLVGPSVTVYSLAPGFVAGRPGAPVAAPQFVASKAVSADGQVASLWTVRTAQGWKVVNIATGGDETDYVGKAHGRGTVFQEPQIDAWYVVRDGRVLPLDPDARRAVGKAGVSLADYQRPGPQEVRRQAPRLRLRPGGQGRRLRRRHGGPAHVLRQRALRLRGHRDGHHLHHDNGLHRGRHRHGRRGRARGLPSSPPHPALAPRRGVTGRRRLRPTEV